MICNDPPVDRDKTQNLWAVDRWYSPVKNALTSEVM